MTRTILFPTDVALDTTYLNDVRFDLSQGEAGTAYITDSSDSGPNGIIVVDLASGQSWRRLHDHATTKAETPPLLHMVVEGEQFLERSEDGQRGAGEDGRRRHRDRRRRQPALLQLPRQPAVVERGDRCAAGPSAVDAEVAETVRPEGDKGSVGDGMETDDRGPLYVTDGEHNAIRRRTPDGSWETVVRDARLLWPDTMSVVADSHLYVTANQLHRQAKHRGGQDQRRSRTCCSAPRSAPGRSGSALSDSTRYADGLKAPAGSRTGSCARRREGLAAGRQPYGESCAKTRGLAAVRGLASRSWRDRV